MRPLKWLVVLCLISGCTDQPAAPTGPVDTTVVLAPGAVADITGTSIRLRFLGVVADSRCPGDALCVWAGDATVRIDVVPSTGGSATYELHTDRTPPVSHGDLTIALTELSPYPFGTRPINPSDYRARIRVTRP